MAFCRTQKHRSLQPTTPLRPASTRFIVQGMTPQFQNVQMDHMALCKVRQQCGSARPRSRNQNRGNRRDPSPGSQPVVLYRRRLTHFCPGRRLNQGLVVRPAASAGQWRNESALWEAGSWKLFAISDFLFLARGGIYGLQTVLYHDQWRMDGPA